MVLSKAHWNPGKSSHWLKWVLTQHQAQGLTRNCFSGKWRFLGLPSFSHICQDFLSNSYKPVWNSIHSINCSSKQCRIFPLHHTGSSLQIPSSASPSSHEMQTAHLKAISHCGPRNITEVREKERFSSIWSSLLTTGWVLEMRAGCRICTLQVEFSLWEEPNPLWGRNLQIQNL